MLRKVIYLKRIIVRIFTNVLLECMYIRTRTAPRFVNPPKCVWNKDSGYQNVYEDGWEIELLRVVGNALNISLDIAIVNKTEYVKDSPAIYVGGYASLPSVKFNFKEPTRSYLTVRFVWYMPYSVKYQWWSLFFNIFSVHLWMSFALSLVLAVITVSCISNYAHKLHLHQSKSYSNIFSVTSNIIAVSLSVSVNTAALFTPTSVLLLLGVLHFSDQHSVPGVRYHIPYRTGIRRTDQNNRGNVKIRKKFRLL